MKLFLQKIMNGIMSIEKSIIIILLPIMCIVILINSLARFTGLFTDKLVWAEEFARYLMIWMSFIGAAMVTQNDEHYKMTAIVDSFGTKTKFVLNILADCITLIFIIVLVKVGIDMVAKLISMGQKTPVMKIPTWIPYLSIPVCMAFSALHLITRVYFRLTDKPDNDEESVV